jgi:hypothetical protein
MLRVDDIGCICQASHAGLDDSNVYFLVCKVSVNKVMYIKAAARSIQGDTLLRVGSVVPPTWSIPRHFFGYGTTTNLKASAVVTSKWLRDPPSLCWHFEIASSWILT